VVIEKAGDFPAFFCIFSLQRSQKWRIGR